MKSNTLTSAVRVSVLLLLVPATCALAQERRPVHFSGLINDYSPLSTTSKAAHGRCMANGQWTSTRTGEPPTSQRI